MARPVAGVTPTSSSSGPSCDDATCAFCGKTHLETRGVYRKQGASTRKVYSTIWNYNPRARLLVFMLPSPNGVLIRRVTDLVKEEKALGLRPPKEDKKGDGGHARSLWVPCTRNKDGAAPK